MYQPEREYFMGLGFERQLEYLRHAWGVEVAVSFNYIGAGRGRGLLNITISVPNLLHRLELYNPPSASYTGVLREGRTLERTMGSALWDWYLDVMRHMDHVNRPDPSQQN